ncbi:MAG: hypothetical protein V2A76_13860 [Planctomycetota bacterium]
MTLASPPTVFSRIALADDAPDWVEMLERVVREVSKRGRKRR